MSTAGPGPGRVLELEEQRWFAAATGDANPLHVDPVEARRLFAGAPVVHGVHLALWALDELLRRGPGQRPRRIRADFGRPVAVGVPAELDLTDAGRGRVVVVADGAVATRVTVDLIGGTAPATTAERPPPAGEPAVLDLAACADVEGSLPLQADLEALGARYGAAVAADPGLVAGLATLTRLVGMVVPGRHSVFTALDVTVPEAPGPGTAVRYETARLSEGLRMVQLAVGNDRLAGHVRALLRPAPVTQASWSAVTERVPSGRFAGRRVLVVGGGRGLGEVAAKTFAAGGAEVVLTWSGGEADAERVAAEIVAGGGRARAARLDVREALGPLPPCDVVAYFAAPRISLDPDTPFSAAQHRELSEVMATGLGRVLAAVDEGTCVVHPSTVYLDDAPAGAGAYVAAKAAAERLLAVVAAERGLRPVQRRLPRLATDQTVSFRGVDAPDPLDVLVPWLVEEVL